MKSVPRCASSKRPTRLAMAPGERALGVAEQLGFGQRLGNGRRVERHEALVRARAVVMDRARDQLLAGAGLALDQHGAVHRRDQLQGLEHLLHRGALADDVVEPVAIAKLCADRNECGTTQFQHGRAIYREIAMCVAHAPACQPFAPRSGAGGSVLRRRWHQAGDSPAISRAECCTMRVRSPDDAQSPLESACFGTEKNESAGRDQSEGIYAGFAHAPRSG